mgnify:CR=1 FL=1
MNGSGAAFDFDLPYGEAGENYARDVLGWTFRGGVKVEVKRKRRMDDWIYVELRQNARGAGYWYPSGLAITTADLWAYVVAGTGTILYFPTTLLRLAVSREEGRYTETTDSDNPTEGRLMGVSRLLQLSGEEFANGP